jgi:hypothetical protein
VAVLRDSECALHDRDDDHVVAVEIPVLVPVVGGPSPDHAFRRVLLNGAPLRHKDMKAFSSNEGKAIGGVFEGGSQIPNRGLRRDIPHPCGGLHSGTCEPGDVSPARSY